MKYKTICKNYISCGQKMYRRGDVLPENAVDGETYARLLKEGAITVLEEAELKDEADILAAVKAQAEQAEPEQGEEPEADEGEETEEAEEAEAVSMTIDAAEAIVEDEPAPRKSRGRK